MISSGELNLTAEDSLDHLYTVELFLNVMRERDDLLCFLVVTLLLGCWEKKPTMSHQEATTFSEFRGTAVQPGKGD